MGVTTSPVERGTSRTKPRDRKLTYLSPRNRPMDEGGAFWMTKERKARDRAQGSAAVVRSVEFILRAAGAMEGFR